MAAPLARVALAPSPSKGWEFLSTVTSGAKQYEQTLILQNYRLTNFFFAFFCSGSSVSGSLYALGSSYAQVLLFQVLRMLFVCSKFPF
jgi:hypothetical protein